MAKIMNKYPKRKPTRLKEYDYSNSGWYFVTICSYNRSNIFGEYKNIVGAGLVSARNNINLSTIGQIIDNRWNDIPNQYENVALDQYIIMPNHIHGIMIINNIDKREEASPSPTISDIICSFKSKSTMEYLNYLKRNNIHMPMHIWQRSFYDHIIQNNKSLHKIREYIVNNPATWDNDEHNPDKKGHNKSEGAGSGLNY
ncbi:MAG: transposase [Candidatus Omnitrophica bacterium]|nr:transposase [Candidatus Omnitrophota bacterium]MBU4478220.1 transposase [Candidatus Omnitrophota bacterium]MCG2703380.1 transposase [Candidatus Omnitrophota bacterium]